MALSKDCNKLIKVYDKKLIEDHKTNFEAKRMNLDYLVDFLRYLRDYYILTDKVVEDPLDNLKLVSIATAIEEYEAFITCVHKYYAIDGKTVVKKIEGTAEDVGKLYAAERTSHWNAFWDIIKAHAESWGLNDVGN